MPTYVYRCQKCGEEIEVVQSMSDPPLKRCKACRGALKRVYHPVGIVLKGSGFYKTDYASSSGSGGRTPRKRDQDAGDPSGSAEGKSKSSDSQPSKESEGSKDSGSTKKKTSGSNDT